MNRWLTLVVLACVCVSSTAQDTNESLVDALREMALPLRNVDELKPLIDRAADKPFVLLGEASHGTSEFYSWRAHISKRLIEEHDFSFIAVEGDWDACSRVNAYVKELSGAPESAEAALRAFERWPQWMWANREIEALVEWLRDFNRDRPNNKRVGFYGIDVYGLEGSMAATLAWAEEADTELADIVRSAYACLEPWAANPHDYARAHQAGAVDCARAIASVVDAFVERADALRAKDEKGWFTAKQHALVVMNAERHYRAMTRPDAASWNKRAAHFHLTVERLADFHGDNAKGIVWAHNTHIGDARATSMAAAGRGNIGQFLREKQGVDNVFAVGFGTHRGVVLAGSSWGAPMERMTIPPAMPGSFEDALRQTGKERALLLFDPTHRRNALARPLGHRAIGVIYAPARERHGNYVETIIPRRYDAFIYIEETTPLTPIS